MAEWVSFIVSLLILARAVYTDVKSGKIENRLMAAGMAAGVVSACLRGGFEGALYSIWMSGIVFLVLFLLFVLKGLGGGDIKLLGVVAVFLPERIWSVVILSFVLGAGMAVAGMLCRRIRRGTFYVRKEQINFSIPVAMGTVIAFLWR